MYQADISAAVTSITDDCAPRRSPVEEPEPALQLDDPSGRLVESRRGEQAAADRSENRLPRPGLGGAGTLDQDEVGAPAERGDRRVGDRPECLDRTGGEVIGDSRSAEPEPQAQQALGDRGGLR